MKRESLAKFAIVSSWYVAKFSRDIYLPSLPAIVVALATSKNVMQHTVAAYFLALGLSRFIFAPLSDIYGRRNIILLTLPLFILGSILCFSAINMPEFIIGRLLQGLGIGCVTAIGRAMVHDVYGKHKAAKGLAYLSITAVWAPAIATMLGGHIQQWFGWRLNFLILIMVGLLLFLQCYFILRETNVEKQSTSNVIHNVLSTYKELLSNKNYYRYLLTYSFIFAGTVVYFTDSPFIFIGALKISPATYGYFAFGTIGGMLIGKLFAAYLNDRVSIDKAIFIGLCIGLVAGILMLELALHAKARVIFILGPSIIYFIAMGIMSPTSKAASMGVKPGTAGSAAALFGLAQGLASTGAGIAVAQMHNKTGQPMGMTLIVLSSLGLLSFILLRDKNKTSRLIRYLGIGDFRG